MVLPSSLKNYFLKIVEDKTIPHLIFHSRNAGSGKTSTAKALCEDLGIDDYKYINASMEAGIDTLRTEITRYVTTASFSGNRKVVILDDMGSNTRAFQEALKVFIEEYSKNTSFILATNNIHLIDEKIQSRCQIKDFNFSSKEEKEEILKIALPRFKKILEMEKVEFDEKSLNSVCERYYPDIRKMTGVLQDLAKMYGKIPENVAGIDTDYSALFDLIFKKDIGACRKLIIENSYNIPDIYSVLFREFVPLVKSPEVQNVVILIVAKWADIHTRSIDHELVITACIVDIISKLK